MPFVAIVFGALLIGLGLQAYYDFADFLGVDKHQPTALIPAAIGGVLVLLGLIGMAGGAARKHAMHLAAMVGLIGFGGALYRPVKMLIDGSFDFNKIPTRLQLVTAGLCISFVLLCVQSFINARKRREAVGAWPE